MPKKLLNNIKPFKKDSDSHVIELSSKFKTALVFNRNAKRVSFSLIRKILKWHSTQEGIDIFITETLEEADRLYEDIAKAGYDYVIIAGGDGTLIKAINSINYFIEKHSIVKIPELGVFPLGTGNAVAKCVHQSGDRLPLRLLGQKRPSLAINLITDGENDFFFGGFGFDGLILNDYKTMVNKLKSKFAKFFLEGIFGYLYTSFFISVPNMIKNGYNFNIRVKTLDDAYYINSEAGDMVEKVDGEIIFEGKAGFLGVATTPFMGYGFKLFPFGGMMDEFFHLRVSTIHPLQAAFNLPSIWKGHYRCKEFNDFFVKNIVVEMEKPSPYQHSGEAMGYVEKLTFRICPKKLKLLKF